MSERKMITTSITIEDKSQKMTLQESLTHLENQVTLVAEVVNELLERVAYLEDQTSELGENSEV